MECLGQIVMTIDDLIMKEEDELRTVRSMIPDLVEALIRVEILNVRLGHLQVLLIRFWNQLGSHHPILNHMPRLGTSELFHGILHIWWQTLHGGVPDIG